MKGKESVRRPVQMGANVATPNGGHDVEVVE